MKNTKSGFYIKAGIGNETVKTGLHRPHEEMDKTFLKILGEILQSFEIENVNPTKWIKKR